MSCIYVSLNFFGSWCIYFWGFFGKRVGSSESIDIFGIVWWSVFNDNDFDLIGYILV